MKPREGERRDRRDRFSSQPFSGDDAFRAAHLHRLWIFEPAPDERAREIHHLVVVSVPADWRGDWLGYVSLLALIDRDPIRNNRKQVSAFRGQKFCANVIVNERAEVAQW